MAAEEEGVGRGWLDTIGVVIGALLLALLIQWVLVKPYRIPSESMVPTLAIGQRVLVDRLTENFSDPKVGQIVVFNPPRGADDEFDEKCAQPRREATACLTARSGKSSTTYIKRVVGGPGDKLRISGGHVIRNGVAVDESYADSCDEEICNLAEFTVPPGSYYMMGDNRDESSDSRYWGPVPRDYVIGRAFATYWPVKRIGGL